MRKLALLLITLSFANIAKAATFQEDLHQRRTRFMERLGSDSMLILWSALAGEMGGERKNDGGK